MVTKIAYNTGYDAQSGEVSFTTPCPHFYGVRVASEYCCRCIYFAAITMNPQVECSKPVEEVINDDGGFSKSRPYNLSSEARKPVQTKIQWE